MSILHLSRNDTRKGSIPGHALWVNGTSTTLDAELFETAIAEPFFLPTMLSAAMVSCTLAETLAHSSRRSAHETFAVPRWIGFPVLTHGDGGHGTAFSR